MIRRLASLLYLAYELSVLYLRKLWKMVTGRPRGKELFERNYRPDRLASLSLDERGRQFGQDGCINCGACEAALVEDRGEGPPPDLLPQEVALAASRSFPDADAGLERVDLLQASGICRGAERACPMGVPLGQIAASVRSNADLI